MTACSKLTWLVLMVVISFGLLLEMGHCYDADVTYSKEPTDEKELVEYIKKLHWEAKFFKCNGVDCFKLQISHDLHPWRNGISKKQLKDLMNDITLVHYKIVDHKLYRKSRCYISKRCESTETMLKQIIDELPDTEFFVNYKDYGVRYGDKASPVFSYTRHQVYKDIMFPVWSFVAGGPVVSGVYPIGVGNWKEMRLKVYNTGKSIPWEEKKDQAFFRGARNNDLRDHAVKLNDEYPDLYDVKYIKNQAWRSIKDSGDYEPVNPIPMQDFCEYRYLLDLISHTAPSRSRHLYLCGSTVLRVLSFEKEFFHTALKPWVHFVPINRNFTDIHEKLTFIRKNPEIGKQIAENGRNLIYNNLSYEVVLEYFKELLIQYSKLTTWSIEDDLESFELLSTGDHHQNEKYKDEL